MVASPRGYRNLTLSFGYGNVLVPVKLVVTDPESEGAEGSFVTRHRQCGGRIKMPKVCDKCEQKLVKEDIERVYEYVPERYIEITDEDEEALPQTDKKEVVLSDFVDASEINPILHNGTYYLYPQPVGLAAYELLSRTLAARGRVGVGRITLTTREQLCQVRAQGNGLVLDLLRWPSRLREQPERDVFDPSAEALAITASVIDTLTTSFDTAKYTDNYGVALQALLKRKIKGLPAAERAATPVLPQALDIMAALKASLEAAKAARQPAVLPEPEAKPKTGRKRRAA